MPHLNGEYPLGTETHLLGGIGSDGKVKRFAVGSDGSILSSPGAGTEPTATPTIDDVTSSGSVAAGAKSLWFSFSSDFVGTILGRTYSGATDSGVTIAVPAGHVLAAVAYTRSAGTLTIGKTV